ncbi:MAG: O-antigen ligase C-terminal domain-containing protein [Rhizobacter sp.]|nr:O-antigen ligase C-terminal domain-containing protein [Rhizobacter sp.]
MNRWGLSICAWLLLASWMVSNHYAPWGSAHSEVLACAAAVALAVAGLGRAAPPIRVDRPVLFLLAIALVPLAQVAIGQIFFAGDGWIAALYLGCAAWTTLWSAHAARVDQDRFVRSLATALAAGALFSSLLAITQVCLVSTGPLGLFIAAVPPGHAPFANFGQPNHLNDLLALGLAALMLMYERRWVSGAFAATGAALFTGTMVITQSRAGLVLFAAAILWHALFARRAGLRTPRAAIVAFAAAWCALFAVWSRVLDVVELSAAPALTSRLQAGPRTVIWAQLWEAIWVRPWTGFGWNQVSVAQMAVAGDYPRSRLSEHSHNLLLDLMLWNGVPLALLIAAVATWWLVRSALKVRSANGAFAVLVLGLLLTHSMIEFPLEYLYFLVPFGMALGILMVEAGSKPVWVVSRPAGFAALLAFVGVAGSAAGDYWRVEEAYRAMRFTVARIGTVPANARTPPLDTQFTQLSAFYEFSMSAPRAGLDAAELAWMGRVAHRYGYAPTLHRYAVAQALNGDLSGARLTLLQLRQLHGDRPYAEAKEEMRQMADQHPELRKLQLP